MAGTWHYNAYPILAGMLAAQPAASGTATSRPLTLLPAPLWAPATPARPPPPRSTLHTPWQCPLTLLAAPLEHQRLVLAAQLGQRQLALPQLDSHAVHLLAQQPRLALHTQQAHTMG